MSENGNVRKELGSVVEQILGSLETDDTGLLHDMENEYPNLRVLLLGGAPGSGRAPSASLSFSRSSSGIVCRLAIAPLGVVAEFDCKSFYGTLEVIELELAQRTIGWRPDWRRSKKERSAWDGVV